MLKHNLISHLACPKAPVDDDSFANAGQSVIIPAFMEIRNLSSLIFVALTVGMLVGCANKQPPPPPPTPVPVKPTPPYTWNDTGEKGPAKIVVNVSAQRAYFFRGENCIGETKCSSGKKGFRTRLGSFAVTQKNKNHVSNLYGNFVNEAGETVKRDVDMSKMTVPDGCSFKGAKMPYFMRFTGGYGLHAGHVPNYPASHGCVRLPRIMAERFFANCHVGTPVIVHE